MILKKGQGWGYMLVIRLSCGHACEVLPEWVSTDGRMSRVQCTTCRVITPELVLEGWSQ